MHLVIKLDEVLILKKYVVLLLVLVIFVMPIKVSAVSVSAKAAVVLNGDDGEVIFSKNDDQKLPMASTTKIMTGLLLCEYGNFEREITVTEKMLMVEGSSMGLLPGDKITLHDLLYGLMLASGNDAANVIAYVLGGSIDGFVNQMNQKAKELGLDNTHFATPSGLDADDHYTTAYELGILTLYAMKNAEFAKAVFCEKATLNYGNPPYKRSLTNHNKMLKMYDGAVGVKTGFTKKSGRCLVTAAKRDGKFVIAVTLNAPSDWSDHKKLLDYGFSQIKQTHYSPSIDCYNLPVINGKSEIFSVKIEPLTLNTLDTEDIKSEVFLPKFLYAPIEKGDCLGKVVYYQGKKVIFEKEILAQSDVAACEIPKNTVDIVFENFKHILRNI